MRKYKIVCMAITLIMQSLYLPIEVNAAVENGEIIITPTGKIYPSTLEGYGWIINVTGTPGGVMSYTFNVGGTMYGGPSSITAGETENGYIKLLDDYDDSGNILPMPDSFTVNLDIKPKGFIRTTVDKGDDDGFYRRSLNFNKHASVRFEVGIDKDTGIVRSRSRYKFINLTRGETVSYNSIIPKTWKVGDLLLLAHYQDNGTWLSSWIDYTYVHITSMGDVDITPPTATHTLSNTNWTNSGINVNVYAQDSGWGVKSVTNGLENILGSNISLLVSTNGTYMFSATDTADNILQYPVSISNIDTIKPTVRVNMSII